MPKFQSNQKLYIIQIIIPNKKDVVLIDRDDYDRVKHFIRCRVRKY
jgi:hypothetical protein